MVVALTMATQKTAPSQKACTLQHPSLPALLLKGAWCIQDLKQHLKPEPQLQCHLESPALHPTAAAGNISSSSLLLQRAIEKWGQTQERAFSFFQYTEIFWGPALGLCGEYWRGLMTWAELLVVCFTTLPSTTVPLPHYEERSSDHGLSPGGSDFRLLCGSWGSCHLCLSPASPALLAEASGKCQPGSQRW